MKQNNLGIFTPILFGLASIAILTVVIYKILGQAKAGETVDSEAYNQITNLEEDTSDTLGWVGILITALVGFAVLGVFAFRR